MSPSTTKLCGLVPSPAGTPAKTYSMVKPLFPLSFPLSIIHSLEPGVEITSPSPLTSCSTAPSPGKTSSCDTCTTMPPVLPELEHLSRNYTPQPCRDTLLAAGTSTPLQTHPALVSSANLLMCLLSPPAHKCSLGPKQPGSASSLYPAAFAVDLGF